MDKVNSEQAQPMADQTFLTVKQTAKLAHVSTSTVVGAIHRKRIIGHRVGSRNWVIPASQVEVLQHEVSEGRKRSRAAGTENIAVARSAWRGQLEAINKKLDVLMKAFDIKD